MAESPRWLMKLCRHEPETRWFRRVILRRKVRVIVDGIFVPSDMDWHRNLNRPDSLRFVGQDLSGWLLERRSP